MKQSVRSSISRKWLCLVALVASVVIPVTAAPSATASEVGNPGTISARVTGGTMKIGALDAFDLGGIEPKPTLTGTIGANGVYTFPLAGINFPPIEADLDGTLLQIYIQATGSAAWTGTLDPDTGALDTDSGSFDLTGRLRVRIAGNPGIDLGSSCYIGNNTTSNIFLDPATTGTQPAIGNMPEVTGVPYDQETGKLTAVNNKFSVPAASGCAILGAADATLNNLAGLPSASGQNRIALDFEITPPKVAPMTPRYSASPINGRVPFTVDFDASNSISSVGPITAYKWDFDGDGTVDQTTETPTTSHLYETAGVYPTRLTTVAGGEEVTKQRQTVTARAVVTSYTARPPASSQSRNPHFEFQANEDGATFECRLLPTEAEYTPCTTPKDYTDLPDNDYELRVRATVDGSTGLPASAPFRVDNIGPVGTITDKPANRVNANVTSGEVDFQANEPSTFECRFTPTTGNPTPPEPQFEPCDSPAAVSWEAVEGTNTFEVRPTDTAGNVGNIVSTTWVVDLTPPTTAISYSPPNPTNAVGGTYQRQCFAGTLACLLSPTYEEVTSAGNTAQRFDFAANESNSTYICKWNDQDERPCRSGIQTGAGFQDPGAVIRASLSSGQRRLGNAEELNVTNMIEGNNTFRVWAVDEAGNRQTNPTTYTLVYDTTKPTITALAGPPAWTKTASHTLVFQSNEPVQTNSFQCRFITNTGNTVTSFATGTGASTGWVTCDPGQLSNNLGWFNTSTQAGLLTDGRKGLQVRATDITGNVHTSNNDVLTGNGPGLTRYWTVDNGVPVVSFAAGGIQPGTNTLSKTATVNLSATDTPVNFGTNQTGTNAIPAQTPSYQCSLNEFGSTSVGFTPCTTPVSLTGLTPGKKSFRVKVTDQATNESAIIERNWTVVDDSNKSVTFTNTPLAVSGSKNATFDFTPNNGTSQCRIDASDAQFAADSNWTSCPSGTASYTNLAEGFHRLEVRASPTDIPAIYEWNIYSTTPVATYTQTAGSLTGTVVGQPGILRPDGKRYTGLDKSSHTMTFSAPANPAYAPGATTFECRYYLSTDTAPAFAPCTSPQDVTWNRLGDGQTRRFEVRPTSSTGNVGAIATAEWTIVSTRPAIDAGDGTGTRTACGTGVLGGPGPVNCVATATSTQPASLSNVSGTAGPQFQAYSSKPIAIPVTAVAGANAGGFACQLNGGTVQNPCTARTSIASGPRSSGQALTVTVGSTARSATGDSFGSAVLATAPSAQNTFRIWAVDLGGNLSAESVDYTWTVDTTIPGFAITSPTPARTNAENVVVDILANEAISSDADGFKCNLVPNGTTTTNATATTGWSNCTNRIDSDQAQWVGTGLAEGNYALDIRGYDLLRQVQTGTSSTTRPTTTDNNVLGRRYIFTIDRTAPVSAITSGVANDGTVGTGTGQFAFNTNEPAAQIASYQCRIDPVDPDDLGEGWSACTSPFSYEDLADGEHKFQVRALDTAGNQGLPLTRTFTVNTTKPEIELTSDPDIDGKRTRETTANIAFALDPADSIAECRLIKPGEEPSEVTWTANCTSPQALSALSDGENRFQVRATNTLGVQSEVSELTWTVATAAPAVTIDPDSGPASKTKATTAEFTFSSNGQGATFACQLDTEAPESCESPKSYGPIGEGEHTFSVIATDDVGNVSAPDSRTWTVDLTAPVAEITSGPEASVEDKTAFFGFGSDDPDATFECALDEEPFASCESPLTVNGLSVGDHKVRVRATDLVGNTGPADEWDWTVTAPPTCPEGQIGIPPNCDDPPEGETRRIVASLTEGTLGLAALGEVPLEADTLVMDGSLYPNGDWIVPTSGVAFRPITQTIDVPNLGSVTVKISISASAAGTGNLANGGGAASFNLPVQAKIEASLGELALIGPEADCALRPVTFDLTGTYDEAGDVVQIGAPDISFPTVSAGCGALGGTVNTLLELPRSDIGLDMTFNTVKSAIDCPEGQVGTPPNCENAPCPEGQVGTPPDCFQPCLDGQIGTPPNCENPPDDKCKDDETGVFPNCVKKAPKLSQPKVKAKAKVKSGKSVTITYSVRNTGNAPAANVKVCLTLKKAGKLVKGKAKRCKTIKTIAAGKTANAKFNVKTRKITSKKSRLAFAVTAAYVGRDGASKTSKSGFVTLMK